MNKNLERPALQRAIVKGRRYVSSNFELVLQIIENSSSEDFDLIKKVTQRVTLSEVQNALINRGVRTE